jgi:uncharacterized protein YndB with AHSA1/START domain
MENSRHLRRSMPCRDPEPSPAASRRLPASGLKQVEKKYRPSTGKLQAVRLVRKAWTTPEGVRSFFAPECRIELRPGGAYKMYFNPSAEPGRRGGEGMIVLALQEERMLSFTWNAPPSLPKIRSQMTHVTVRLYPTAASGTRVVLRHDGWGYGGQWDEAFRYFERAWGEIVLPRLSRFFDQGAR